MQSVITYINLSRVLSISNNNYPRMPKFYSSLKNVSQETSVNLIYGGIASINKIRFSKGGSKQLLLIPQGSTNVPYVCLCRCGACKAQDQSITTLLPE